MKPIFTADSFITQTVGVEISTAVGRVISYDGSTGVLKYWQNRTNAGFNTDGSDNTSPQYGLKSSDSLLPLRWRVTYN